MIFEIDFGRSGMTTTQISNATKQSRTGLRKNEKAAKHFSQKIRQLEVSQNKVKIFDAIGYRKNSGNQNKSKTMIKRDWKTRQNDRGQIKYE